MEGVPNFPCASGKSAGSLWSVGVLDFPLDFPDFPVIGGCPQFSICDRWVSAIFHLKDKDGRTPLDLTADTSKEAAEDLRVAGGKRGEDLP